MGVWVESSLPIGPGMLTTQLLWPALGYRAGSGLKEVGGTTFGLASKVFYDLGNKTYLFYKNSSLSLIWLSLKWFAWIL